MKKLLLGAAACGLFFTACQRDSDDTSNVFADDATSQELYDDIYSQANTTAEDNAGFRNGCATLSGDTSAQDTTFPKTVVVDFGTSCTGRNGRVRSGSLTITFSQRWRTAGAVITIVPNNYTVNGYQIAGTVTITNNGLNSSQQQSWTHVCSNGTVTTPQGATLTRSYNHTITRTAGEATSDPLDDVFQVTGSSSGTNRNGTAFTRVITSPIVRPMSCEWATQGTVETTPAGGTTRTLDFGTGTCDNQATLNLRRGTTTITLP